MAVPKRKQTPSRTGMRRSQNMKITTKNIIEDKKTGEYRLSHHLDLKNRYVQGSTSFGSKGIDLILHVRTYKNCS